MRRVFLRGLWTALALTLVLGRMNATVAEDSNVEQGFNLFLKSQYVDALDMVERYLKEHPEARGADAAKALHVKGRCLWGLGKYDQAIHVLEQHLREFPTDRFCAESALFISTAYYRTRLSNMIGPAKRTIHDYPGSHRAKQALWWLPIAATNALERRDIALAYTEQYVTLFPDEKDATLMGTQYYRTGDYCSVLGDYAKSAEYFKKYLDAYPEGLFAPVAAGKYRDVKRKVKRMAEIDWDVLRQEAVERGARWDDEALKNPSATLGLRALELLLALAQSGKLGIDQASRETNAFLTLNPSLDTEKQAHVRLELAKAYLKNNKLEEGKKELEAIEKTFPQTESAEEAQREIEEMK